jgi:predicted DNA-binding transcriptional regulator AlpA
MTTIDTNARLLFRKDVARKTGIRPHTLEMLIRRGRFPAPVRLGHRRAWSEPEIEAWLTDRFAERDRKTMMVSGLRSVSVLDRCGCVVEAIGGKPYGVFLQ